MPASFAPTTVTVVTHDSFALSKDLLEDFRSRTGITVRIATGGDAGEVVNKAALTAGNPEGDVLFGVDNTLLGRAAAAGVFDAYESPSAGSVPQQLRDGTAAGHAGRLRRRLRQRRRRLVHRQGFPRRGPSTT